MADMIKTIIVEDEPLARKGLKNLLRKEPDIEVACECEDGVSAVSSIKQFGPDLIFLDVQMPGLDGFQVLKSLAPDDIPMTVFITAYDKYAVKAFETHAVDYLLKPVEPQRLHSSLEKVRRVLKTKQQSEFNQGVLDLLEHFQSCEQYLSRFAVKLKGKVYFIKVDDISWVEGAGDYVRLHVNNENYMLRKTMNQLERELDPKRFLRIHRSSIVNVDKIREMKSLSTGDYLVILHDGKRLNLSRTFKNRIAILMNEFP